MTGLHLTAYFGVKEAIGILFKMRVYTNLKDKYDRTPLSYAAMNGYEAAVKQLLATN